MMRTPLLLHYTISSKTPVASLSAAGSCEPHLTTSFFAKCSTCSISQWELLWVQLFTFDIMMGKCSHLHDRINRKVYAKPNCNCTYTCILQKLWRFVRREHSVEGQSGGWVGPCRPAHWCVKLRLDSYNRDVYFMQNYVAMQWSNSWQTTSIQSCTESSRDPHRHRHRHFTQTRT